MGVGYAPPAGASAFGTSRPGRAAGHPVAHSLPVTSHARVVTYRHVQQSGPGTDHRRGPDHTPLQHRSGADDRTLHQHAAAHHGALSDDGMWSDDRASADCSAHHRPRLDERASVGHRHGR